MKIRQLPLFEPKRRMVNWHQLERPFSCRYSVEPTSEFGQFSYYDRETDRIYFSPVNMPLYFWIDKETGKLVSGFKVPDWVKAERQKKREAMLAEAAETEMEPPPVKRKRKSTKWSKEAKGRNRRRLLWKRIEKKILGKSGKDLDYTQTLFADDYKAMIDTEYMAHLDAHPAYYAGEDVNLYE